MTVPTEQEFLPGYLVDVNDFVLSFIEQTGTSGCSIKIYSATDSVLASVALDDPPGSVDGVTGTLTLTPILGATVSSSGTAAYAAICNSAGTQVLRMPCLQGETAVRGRLVLTSLTFIAGAAINLNSIEIGA